MGLLRAAPEPTESRAHERLWPRCSATWRTPASSAPENTDRRREPPEGRGREATESEEIAF